MFFRIIGFLVSVRGRELGEVRYFCCVFVVIFLRVVLGMWVFEFGFFLFFKGRGLGFGWVRSRVLGFAGLVFYLLWGL